jgi:hypothetical protein
LNEGRGRRLAREAKRWFIVVSILSTPRANFHARGLAGQLPRPAEASCSIVSLAGLRAHAGRHAAEQRIVAPDTALFQGELVPG